MPSAAPQQIARLMNVEFGELSCVSKSIRHTSPQVSLRVRTDLPRRQPSFAAGSEILDMHAVIKEGISGTTVSPSGVGLGNSLGVWLIAGDTHSQERKTARTIAFSSSRACSIAPRDQDLAYKQWSQMVMELVSMAAGHMSQADSV
jgi:hypothetical protein